MKIGIDAREMMGRPTGVGRYLAELLRAWGHPSTGLTGRHQFFLYGPEGLTPAARALCDPLQAVERVVPGSGRTLWEQVRLPGAVRGDRLDVFFAPAYTAPPLTGCPQVVTVHDLSFCAHPEWFSWREGLRRRLLTRASAARASLVLTDSHFSAREIHAHLGVPATRVRVIPLGVAPPVPDLHPPDAPSGRAPLILFVGSIFNRRRLPDLLEAFAVLARRRPDVRLLVIGENRTFPRQDLDRLAADLRIADQVALRRYVPDAELADAYRTASVFAFLSDYEGFGLTPLEAMACGIPPVVLDTAVAREVCGPAAAYVPAGNIAAIASALGELLDDPQRRQAQLAAATTVLARYSWDAAARSTMAALEDAGGAR